MTRVLRFVIHNWPLKLAAVGLATLLYGGLVLSQTTQEFTRAVPIVIENAPADVVVLSNLGSVTRIRYVAPPDLGLRIDATTFKAVVDLAGVTPTGGPVSLPVSVEAVDSRIQVLDSEPGSIVVTLDRVGSKSVPIRAVLGPIPSGLDAGDPIVDGTTATITGPQSVVDTVAEVQAFISIDASGVDINQLVDLQAVDAEGGSLERIDVEPTQVRVRVPVFTDKRSKTLPVTPNVVGTPAAGFEVASIEVDPPAVSVEGDANDLAGLDRADTLPISVAGASSQVTQIVGFALPDGVQALGSSTVQVTVKLRPVTGTRTFEAGLVLVGARADLTYALSTDHVLVTIGGSLADLDRLSGVALVLTADVTGLEAGQHSVTVSANLATGLTLVGASPNPVTVTVSSPAASPAASPGPSPTP
ncbi:MAG TPA: CdaR family protein [Candidatus Limnocylindrales bacterium]|nr:CdaR family protein [Candidatus Limnocylindrales bacterium]